MSCLGIVGLRWWYKITHSVWGDKAGGNGAYAPLFAGTYALLLAMKHKQKKYNVIRTVVVNVHKRRIKTNKGEDV